MLPTGVIRRSDAFFAWFPICLTFDCLTGLSEIGSSFVASSQKEAFSPRVFQHCVRIVVGLSNAAFRSGVVWGGPWRRLRDFCGLETKRDTMNKWDVNLFAQ